MVLILIIIFIVYAYRTGKKVDELEEENRKLRKKLEEQYNIQSNSLNNVVISNIENKKDNIIIKQIVKERKDENITKKDEELIKKKQRKKIEREERQRKNTNILITGALLIVLSAIVFLMSTWNAIPNIIKTSVIVLLVGVFLGASKIAKEKFKLEKTSNTFFYIAMAYIPICFLAFSFFGLFGQYLSIYGEGKYIYLTIAMMLNSAIYYLYYKDRKENLLFYGSILSQICALILFGLIFGNNIYFIFSILLLYNIALILLTKKNMELELLRYFYTGIPYTIAFLLLFFFQKSMGYMVFLLVILTINFFLLYMYKSKELLNAYLFNISLYSLGIYFTTMYDIITNINLKLIVILTYIVIALILEAYVFKKSNDSILLNSSTVIGLISLTSIYLWSIQLNSNLHIQVIIKPYIISILETLIMLVVFIKSKKFGKNILGYLIPFFLTITIYNILLEVGASYHFYIISLLMIFAIGQVIVWENFEQLNKGFLVISNIFISFIYFILTISNSKFNDDVIYLILLDLVYIYSFVKNKKYIIFKYLSYITCNFVLLTMINFVGGLDDIKYLIPVLVSVGVIFIESKYEYLKDQFSGIFNIIYQIISYCFLIELGELQTVFISFLYSVYLIYDNLKTSKIYLLRIIPLLGFLFTVYLSYIDIEYLQSIMLISTIVLTTMTVYKKKITIDTIFSAIYLFLTMSLFENDYIKEIFLLVWSITNLYFVNNSNEKYVFKAVAYFASLLLYETFINNLDLDYYESFKIIGIVIFSIATLKNIVSKYIKNMDTIEYIIYIITNLFAIMMYADEKDGMIYVLFLVGLLIYSYNKKYGVLFIVSMFTILANAILLTREFWFNVPWWIYLLLIGTILIAFAVKNESDENKQKRINVGNMIKNLKDKIEK